MNSLDISGMKETDLIDEKVAAKTRKELEEYFTKLNGKDYDSFIELRAKKTGDNQFVDIPREIIEAMIKVLKGIENKDCVVVAGKKALVTAQQAKKMIGASDSMFEEMIKNKNVKFHEHNAYKFYVSMEDIIKCRAIVFEEKGKALDEIVKLDRQIENELN